MEVQLFPARRYFPRLIRPARVTSPRCKGVREEAKRRGKRKEMKKNPTRPSDRWSGFFRFQLPPGEPRGFVGHSGYLSSSASRRQTVNTAKPIKTMSRRGRVCRCRRVRDWEEVRLARLRNVAPWTRKRKHKL